MTDYKVAIPSYNRSDVIVKKTLTTLANGGVAANKVFIFVANKEEEKKYITAVPRELYNKIVVGKKGISNQRKFIVKYFPEGEHIVSMDDDIEGVFKLSGDNLVQIRNIDKFIYDAFNMLVKEGLYIWGIYPVNNPFFMQAKKTTGLKFIIGLMRGFINRHSKKLEPSAVLECKEDYEESILYYLMDGGVLRFNNVTVKTKFNAKGGLGEERFDMNKYAAEYLEKKYPDIITIFHRKNGMTEVRLAKLPRVNHV
jgi:hypothetical protein